ncbi:MAG: hypothetical protein Q9182_004357 [Xanthomendoza sp. 2 TL-2023]
MFLELLHMWFLNIHYKYRDEKSVAEKAATIARSTPDSPKDARFIQNLHRLPREIYHQIQEDFLELAFFPGFVFPQQRDHKEDLFNWKGKLYPVAKPGLLCLNSHVLAAYQKRLWSENTFVIGEGIASYTTDFLRDLPKDQWKRDLGTISKEHNPELHSINLALMRIWYDKYYCIRMLPLTELTLDFTDCYGVKGDWFGKELAAGLQRPVEGPPSVLTVLAPSEEKRQEILWAMAKAYCLSL